MIIRDDINEEYAYSGYVKAGYGLESLVKIDVLMRDVWDIPIMEEVIKKKFKGKYPARKTIQTEFAHSGGEKGLKFQVDGVAYIGE